VHRNGDDAAVPRRRIVLLGATGFAGRLVLRELVVRGEHPVLLGREESRLTQAAERAGAELPVRRADATAAQELRAVLEPGDVVVSTVGPFVRLGREVARVVAQLGATYLDSTGEPPFVRWVFYELGPIASRSAATLVPAFGYDYVLGNLAGALALTAAGAEAAAIEVGYFLTREGPGELHQRVTPRDAARFGSAGTRASLIGVLGEDSYAYRPVANGQPAVHSERIAARTLSFDLHGVRRWGLSVGGSEHFGLPESFPHLASVEVCLGWFGSATRPIAALAPLVAALARSSPGRQVMARIADRSAKDGGEPDPAARSLAIAVARDRHGNALHRTALAGPNPYELTGMLLAWAASHASRTDLAHGVHGPVAAFGLETLTAGAQECGLHEI
jgi:Saccharopine dehydrogenase NADP binding domain